MNKIRSNRHITTVIGCYWAVTGCYWLLGLRDETTWLRFVTLSVALDFSTEYNQLIRVDTDFFRSRCLWMEQIRNYWI